MRIDRIKLVTELARRDMTQKKLAELAGISRATVNCTKSLARRLVPSNVISLSFQKKIAVFVYMVYC